MSNKPKRRIDLNAARQARAEKSSGPIEVELGDHVFEIPAEMPVFFLVDLASGERAADGLASLVGADRVDDLRSTGLSDKDIEDLMKLAYEADDVGESGASDSS